MRERTIRPTNAVARDLAVSALITMPIKMQARNTYQRAVIAENLLHELSTTLKPRSCLSHFYFSNIFLID